MSVWGIIIGCTSAIIAIELVMLRCFELRRNGIEFPRLVDQSFFRFFTVWRLRSLMVIHSLFCIIVVGLSLFFLW